MKNKIIQNVKTIKKLTFTYTIIQFYIINKHLTCKQTQLLNYVFYKFVYKLSNINHLNRLSISIDKPNK